MVFFCDFRRCFSADKVKFVSGVWSEIWAKRFKSIQFKLIKSNEFYSFKWQTYTNWGTLSTRAVGSPPLDCAGARCSRRLLHRRNNVARRVIIIRLITFCLLSSKTLMMSLVRVRAGTLEHTYRRGASKDSCTYYVIITHALCNKAYAGGNATRIMLTSPVAGN